MRFRIGLLSLLLVLGVVFQSSPGVVSASAEKQADQCSFLPDNGKEFVLNDHYMDHGFFSLFCGIHVQDGQLGDQATLKLNGSSLKITKQGKSYLELQATKPGTSVIQAIMPDQSVVSLTVTVITLAQAEQQRDPHKLTIQEALRLVRLKVSDLGGLYDYSGRDEYGGYHLQDVVTDGEYLGEGSNYFVNPEDGTMYNILNGEYMDNLFSDKHDPPLEPEAIISLLKQRITKNIPANFTLQETGNYVRGSTEFGLYPLVKSARSGQLVPNTTVSPSATYLVNPGTGYVYDSNYQYIGTVFNSKMKLDKNWNIYVNTMLRDYYYVITQAVNNNYIDYLQSILKPGSAIDKQQRKFATTMHASGIKEQFGLSYTIDHTETVSSTIVKIYVTEETRVTPKTGKPYSVKEKWMYQAEEETYSWRFTAMKRWK
ncbi:hypothetical protein [Paenibacillus sp. sgz500958]|uniref:TcaA NTF2-like domain-containing protein n=1 Tax=Paenibacillus sp. sgz500958 TaxID=3242475 RepID=UPI0036D2CE4C